MVATHSCISSAADRAAIAAAIGVRHPYRATGHRHAGAFACGGVITVGPAAAVEIGADAALQGDPGGAHIGLALLGPAAAVDIPHLAAEHGDLGIAGHVGVVAAAVDSITTEVRVIRRGAHNAQGGQGLIDARIQHAVAVEIHIDGGAAFAAVDQQRRAVGEDIR